MRVTSPLASASIQPRAAMLSAVRNPSQCIPEAADHCAPRVCFRTCTRMILLQPGNGREAPTAALFLGRRDLRRSPSFSSRPNQGPYNPFQAGLQTKKFGRLVGFPPRTGVNRRKMWVINISHRAVGFSQQPRRTRNLSHTMNALMAQEVFSEACPASAPFFGYMGAAAALIFASE
jgi:hypothetical protein